MADAVTLGSICNSGDRFRFFTTSTSPLLAATIHSLSQIHANWYFKPCQPARTGQLTAL